MKATNDQYSKLSTILNYQVSRLNLTPRALCGESDCWVLLRRYFAANEESRPTGFGTLRSWIFAGLDDSHIETMFRKYLREAKK